MYDERVERRGRRMRDTEVIGWVDEVEVVLTSRIELYWSI